MSSISATFSLFVNFTASPAARKRCFSAGSTAGIDLRNPYSAGQKAQEPAAAGTQGRAAGRQHSRRRHEAGHSREGTGDPCMYLARVNRCGGVAPAALEDRNMEGKMETWGPQSYTDECFLTCRGVAPAGNSELRLVAVLVRALRRLLCGGIHFLQPRRDNRLQQLLMQVSLRSAVGMTRGSSREHGAVEVNVMPAAAAGNLASQGSRGQHTSRAQAAHRQSSGRQQAAGRAATGQQASPVAAAGTPASPA